VPVGYVLSVVAVYMAQDRSVINLRSFLLYCIPGTAIVVVGSFAALEVIQHIGLVPDEHRH